MMTEDYAICPKCKHDKALTHYSSDGLVNWIACPKCRTFFDHDVETPHDIDEEFWQHVEQDTGWKNHGTTARLSTTQSN